jgi:cellulose synthase/poly-beta-1,6-N-acetylglucosamine synthase-like glycosyltransferase
MHKMATRAPGVSFIVRVRNEEAYLAQNLASLRALLIPHEIIIILHQCTDGSKAIAERARAHGQPVRIHEYNQSVSRAGYETLVTPENHPASFVTYIKYCFSHARYNWLFKWDADFTATPSLIKFLNRELVLEEVAPIAYRIACRLGAEGPLNHEFYLFNCLLHYKKHLFWEYPYFTQGCKKLARKDVIIESIPPTVLKEYWRAPAWFATEDTDDAKRIQAHYERLVGICGPEPMASARASCPENDAVWKNVMAHIKELRSVGIEGWK